MKTPNAKNVWRYWKLNRDREFVEWFEKEIYDGASISEDNRSVEEQSLRDSLNVTR